MANNASYPTVYGFWTNKGGVGKTTLSFHMATTYAELFPEKTVVVIDMCPQTNFSATLLTRTTPYARGDGIVQQMQDIKKAQGEIPKTIGGYLMARLAGIIVPVEKFLISVFTENYNPQVPSNLELVCGDSNLDLLAPALSTRACEANRTAVNIIPYKIVHDYLRDFIQGLAEYYANLRRPKELVVFIDTNPALSIYTEIALCAMTHLVMPVCADTFSLQAVNSMFHLVYGLYPTTSQVAHDYEQESFASKVKAYRMSLPAIACIIHNRDPVVDDSSSGRPVQPKAMRAMAAEQCARLFDGYNKAVRSSVLETVFSVNRNSDNSPVVCSDVKKFAESYTATMRDMRSCGVAALHSGFPLWVLANKANRIDKQFRGLDIRGSLPGLMRDLLYAMEVMTGTNWAQKDEAAMQRLERIAA